MDIVVDPGVRAQRDGPVDGLNSLIAARLEVGCIDDCDVVVVRAGRASGSAGPARPRLG